MKIKKKNAIIILAFILLGAFFLRVNPILEMKDYWYDEAFTGILLKHSWGEMNQMIFDDVHPPLYYWLVKPWAAMFDYSPAGIRSFSALIGILSISSLYWIGSKMFDRRAGLLAASLAAFSPFAIQYSQEARMYELFGFLMIWATWFFYKALKENKRRDWILWGVFGGLSFYTHYLSLFFFIIFYLTFVFYRRIFQKESFKKAILGSIGFWIGTGVIFVFFLTWIKVFIAHMLKGNLGWIGASHLSDIPKTLQIFLFGHPPGTGGVPSSNEFRYFFDGSSAGLLVLVFMTVLFTIAWLKKRKREELFVLGFLSFGTLVFLIIASHFNIKLYVSRYFMPAAIMFYALLAGMIVVMFKKNYAWVVGLFTFGALILMLKPINHNTHWYEATNFVKRNPQFQTIVTSNPFDYTTTRYYFDESKIKYYNKNNPQEDFSKWVVVGNENRLEDSSQVRDLKKPIVLDWSCDWKGVDLKQVEQFKDLKACVIKN
jgi:4-amino-4-deoxy-L-arabinose transferase-like glycosyltransferase